MFKISGKCPVGAAVIIYRELANLLQAMSECYQQPERQLTRLKRIAWGSFEELMMEVSTWLFE
ncbi:MAG: hypothetical protein HY974_02250, partial [Candidatus Kerfeldbacteria bacterium]|nr:hypothetical protein [Candidatus Kerfeldbacteria bacterium]